MKIVGALKALKKRAGELKNEVMALYLACRRPDVPLLAKIIVTIVVGYALSPIDLIPDFVPVLGYLDDLILLPIGISLAIRLIPRHIMDECRIEANKIGKESKPQNRYVAAAIVLLWMLVVYILLDKFIL